MSYYLRAFCASDDLPPLRTVFEWAEGRGVQLEAATADLNTSEWEQAEISYRSDRQAFVAERNVGDLVREEVEEFVELLEDVSDSPDKEKVLDHLERSRVVIAAQVLSDTDDDGYGAVSTFLTYFVENCGGLVQADGEGFYVGDRLIVELE